jgi:hypothetical protein
MVARKRAEGTVLLHRFLERVVRGLAQIFGALRSTISQPQSAMGISQNRRAAEPEPASSDWKVEAGGASLGALLGILRWEGKISGGVGAGGAQVFPVSLS